MFLEVSQNSQEKTCARVSFLIKLQAIKKETLVQVLSCESCKISKNTFFIERLWWLLLQRHSLIRSFGKDLKQRYTLPLLPSILFPLYWNVFDLQLPSQYMNNLFILYVLQYIYFYFDSEAKEYFNGLTREFTQ